MRKYFPLVVVAGLLALLGFLSKYMPRGDALAARQPNPAAERERAAISACELAAKMRATHPSTVSFSYFHVSYVPGRVESTFTARNSFNLETTHRIVCDFDGDNHLANVQVAEAF